MTATYAQLALADATDEQLVQGAIDARREAESVEIEASPSRWSEADHYAELARRGWTQQRIADDCHSEQSHVSRFLACVELYALGHNRPAFWDAYKAVRPDKANGAHVANNSGDNEWYTPADYIAAALEVMGGIDLDPSSTAEANHVVGATHFFSEADNSLGQLWAGRVWMNPPYAQPLVEQFCTKLAAEFVAGNVTEACVLVNNATETSWFAALADTASAVCFPKGRVRFWHPAKDSATPLQGQAVVYLGNEPEAFVETFARFGRGWVALLGSRGAMETDDE